jgi:hypothetical protein
VASGIDAAKANWQLIPGQTGEAVAEGNSVHGFFLEACIQKGASADLIGGRSLNVD